MKTKVSIKKFIYYLYFSCCILFTFVACGSSDSSSDDTNMDTELKKEYKVDFQDAELFEEALNNKEDTIGKVVRFYVKEYKPDSSLGINCWAGEHLNFISDRELDVKKGDYVTGVIIKKPSNVLGSWKIAYEVITIDAGEDESITDSDEENVQQKETTDTQMDGENIVDVTQKQTTVLAIENKEHYDESLLGRGRADAGRAEPQYVDVIGYVVVAYDEERKLEKSDKFDDTPWVVSTYVQDKQFWIEDDLKIDHKTEVVVRNQLLEHGGYGSYHGYLLVEELKTKRQYYINVSNFITKPYWTYSNDLVSAATAGFLIAEFNQKSDYYPVTGNKKDTKVELDDGTIVLITGADSWEDVIKATVWKEWKYGYGGVSVYFNSEDLTIIY